MRTLPKLAAILSALLAAGAARAAPAEAPAAAPKANLSVPLPPPPAGAGAPAQVDVAVRRLADRLADAQARRPDGRYQRIAVLDLAENGAAAKDRSLGKVVSAELATTLRRDHGWLLVERARLGAILAEQKLGVMGVTDRQAQDVGKVADAQAVVVGSVSEVGDRYLVAARLITVDAGTVVAAASESIQAAGLVSLASEAVVLRSRGDAAFRSAVIPGWGQVYNRQPAKAALFGGGVALLVAGAVGYHLSGAKAESDYRSRTTAAALGGDPAGTAANLRRTAEDRYATRNWLLYGAAGLWLLNVGDAWLGGTDGSRVVAGAVPAEGGGLAFALVGRY
jgi:TolB-like protein